MDEALTTSAFEEEETAAEEEDAEDKEEKVEDREKIMERSRRGAKRKMTRSRVGRRTKGEANVEWKLMDGEKGGEVRSKRNG